jgi:hypothetical protein
MRLGALVHPESLLTAKLLPDIVISRIIKPKLVKLTRSPGGCFSVLVVDARAQGCHRARHPRQRGLARRSGPEYRGSCEQLVSGSTLSRASLSDLFRTRWAANLQSQSVQAPRETGPCQLSNNYLPKPVRILPKTCFLPDHDPITFPVVAALLINQIYVVMVWTFTAPPNSSASHCRLEVRSPCSFLLSFLLTVGPAGRFRTIFRGED